MHALHRHARGQRVERAIEQARVVDQQRRAGRGSHGLERCMRPAPPLDPGPMPTAKHPSRFRLAPDVRPSDYHLHLEPDLDAGTLPRRGAHRRRARAPARRDRRCTPPTWRSSTPTAEVERPGDPAARAARPARRDGHAARGAAAAGRRPRAAPALRGRAQPPSARPLRRAARAARATPSRSARRPTRAASSRASTSRR